MVKIFNADQLDSLKTTAAKSERQRSHLNVHESLDADVQRLFIATQPTTYMRPHRHTESHKWEFFMVLQGKIDLLIFSDEGELLERASMSESTVRAVEVPPGTWHAYACMQENTLAIEVKQGSYIQTTEDDFASWSPAEKSVSADAFRQWMSSAKVGDRFTA